ncbi:MAG: extracellular solute-binding protein [Firmicutes bacterium]|nr:extracellular solute-binding protein [Bacillota bacterium]MCL5038628.1 extracellular solute-binding protein [Bacillota bacterium]
MKRILSIMLVAFLIGTLVTGCGGSGGSSAPETKSQQRADKVTIEYWQYSFGPKVEMINELIKEFETKNPGIRIVHTTFPYEQFNEKVATSIPAGRGPDVINLYYGWLPKYIESKYIQPLPEDAFPSAAIEKDFVPMVQAANFDGKYYALPTAVRTTALLWNKDLFKAAGLDPEKPPTTLEELVSYAKQLTKRDSKGKLLISGVSGDVGGQGQHWFREMLLREFGVTPITDRRKVNYNQNPAGYQAWDYFLSFAGKYKFWEQGFYQDVRTAFNTGHMAMQITGSFELGTIAKDAPNLNLGVGEPPAGPKGRSSFGSFWANAITSKAEGTRRDAAVKFIKFLSSSEVMKRWTKKVGELPARKEFLTNPELVSDPRIGPFMKTLSYSHATFFVDEKAQRDNIMQAYEEVLLKGVDPKKALDELVAKEQALYDSYWAKANKK